MRETRINEANLNKKAKEQNTALTLCTFFYACFLCFYTSNNISHTSDCIRCDAIRNNIYECVSVYASLQTFIFFLLFKDTLLSLLFLLDLFNY